MSISIFIQYSHLILLFIETIKCEETPDLYLFDMKLLHRQMINKSDHRKYPSTKTLNFIIIIYDSV
ncbi:hypothetical protein SAMN05428988_0223 [Chitinophaga sp. YR573]|nr:hypothetical protein SAMN05428988_0223 [Chitinophaga sp. YR573]